MNEYKIEKGIPYIKQGRYSLIQETLKKMEIGDSVLIDGNSAEYYSVRFQTEGKKLGFTIRRTRIEDGVYRVWKLNPQPLTP